MAPAGYGTSVEGVHAVTAAAEAGRVEKLFIESRRRERLTDILSLVPEQTVAVVDDVRSMAETSAPQGVVARCRPIPPVTLDSLGIDGAALLVLDHVEDPHNVGAAARSAVAAGLTGMVVSDRRSAPLSAASFKAAAGALEKIPVAVVGSVPEALNRLKATEVWIVGLDAGSDDSLFDHQLFTESVAVVVGAEGKGLAELTRKRCDVLVSIPMAGGFESLNASVSAALASFEIMRVRKAGES